MSGDFHRGDLERLRKAGRYRELTPRTGIDFASNDYLGLAGDQRLREAVAAG
ncbi:MAG TPA: 8-amino-7-oxononanoate synthase, partial [Sphingomonas sp.]|nr:8-amino-7-oxononanoate synthase [Sphingomonas sp.]